MKFLFLLLIPGLSQALTLSWIAPTQLTDNTPITAPITYNVYTVGSTAWNSLQKGISALTVTLPGPFPQGQQCFAVTAVVNGVESARSTSACLVITPFAPKPPTSLIAQ